MWEKLTYNRRAEKSSNPQPEVWHLTVQGPGALAGRPGNRAAPLAANLTQDRH